MKTINTVIGIFVLLSVFFAGRINGIKHTLDELNQVDSKYMFVMTVNKNKTNTFTWRDGCDVYLDIPSNFSVDEEKQKMGKIKVSCKDIPSNK